MAITSTCLCGESKVIIEGTFDSQAVCHCSDCRAAGGAAYAPAIVVPTKDVKLEGPTKEYHSTSDSGNKVTRTFCSNCGSQLFSSNPAFGPNYIVRTGSIPEMGAIPVKMELFTKSRWSILPAFEGAAQFKTMPGA